MQEDNKFSSCILDETCFLFICGLSNLNIVCDTNGSYFCGFGRKTDVMISSIIWEANCCVFARNIRTRLIETVREY